MLRVSKLFYVMTPRAALKLLALSPTTGLTQKAVKKAYIQRTLECHPDLHPDDPNATENFRNLLEALHIALQALEVKQATAHPTENSVVDEINDPQKSIESLRQAIIAYHAHRDDHREINADVSGTNATSSSNTATETPRDEDDIFFSPSLEYVSRVCQREALAMRRVHTFCEELPTVLSGNQSTSLFEAVAFFHSRYVEYMSTCVMRFSQNLPIIVRRVVKNRKIKISNKKRKITSGIGTKNRPMAQRIEDMTMKPLVLMGALIFDLPDHKSSSEETGSLYSAAKADGSTCGVSSPKDIKVTDELKCTIFPGDSIGIIVEKIGAWEAASFERLKIELATVDATVLISNLLGFNDMEQEDENHPLSVLPHLHHDNADMEKVLATLQKLTVGLCCHFDDTSESAERDADDEDYFQNLVTSLDENEIEKDAKLVESYPIPKLITHCREFFRYAAPLIKGNINLHWSMENSNLANSAEEVGNENVTNESSSSDADKKQTQGRTNKSVKLSAQVGRHPSCCTAEDVFFSVSVEVDKDLSRFLLTLRYALLSVAQQGFRSRRHLPELVEKRELLTKEEFIPVEGQEEVDEEQKKYYYRGPIQCFPRLYNMATSEELRFWNLIHAQREELAQHIPAMNPINLFFNCVPYGEDHDRNKSSETKEDLIAGWVGEGEDGMDNVILTSQVLKEEQEFKNWLEEVVEQSTLNREAQVTLFEAGVGYMRRDPTLPLTNFLSFVKIFVEASAVRSVLEKDVASGKYSTRTNRVIEPTDVGLTIIVGNKCDVKNGGLLFIPWYMDPNALLALLHDESSTPHLDV